MIKKHWYKPGFWGWWWQHRAPDRLRATLIAGVCVVAGGAGYLAAGRLAPAHAATITTVDVHTVKVVDVHTVKVTVTGVTVRRTLTVREKGRVVRTIVPVVHKVIVPPQTTYLTTTNTIYLTHDVTVPVTNTVTVTGRSQTVVQTQTRLVPTVVTHTNVVTHQVTQTVVQVLTQ